MEKIQEVPVGSRLIEVARREGTESRPPLLLINGIGQRWQSLRMLMAAFPPGQTVMTFNAPGIGRSSASAFPYTMPELAGLTTRLMQQLGYGRFSVMGISWGGALAQQLAFAHRERCEKLILAGASMGAFMFPGSPFALGQLVSPWGHLTIDRKVPGAVFGGELRHSPELVSLLAIDKGFAQLAFYHQVLAMSSWTSLPWIHRIEQPTLIMTGNDDPLVPPHNSRFLADKIPNATLEVIEGGHLFPIIQTSLTASIVGRFLA